MSTKTPQYVDRAKLAAACKVHPRTINRCLNQRFNKAHSTIDLLEFCKAVEAQPAAILAAIDGTDELLSVKELSRLWECGKEEVRYLTETLPILKRAARIGGGLRFSRNSAFGGCIGGAA